MVSYNNSKSKSTGKTPYFAIKDFHFIILFYKTSSELVPLAKEFANHMRRIHSDLLVHLRTATSRYKAQADNRRRTAPAYKIGDQVMLETKTLKLHLPTMKFAPRRVGPFKITKIINKAAMQVDIPHHWGKHNVFHVSHLTP